MSDEVGDRRSFIKKDLPEDAGDRRSFIKKDAPADAIIKAQPSIAEGDEGEDAGEEFELPRVDTPGKVSIIGFFKSFRGSRRGKEEGGQALGSSKRAFAKKKGSRKNVKADEAGAADGAGAAGNGNGAGAAAVAAPAAADGAAAAGAAGADGAPAPKPGFLTRMRSKNKKNPPPDAPAPADGAAAAAAAAAAPAAKTEANSHGN